MTSRSVSSRRPGFSTLLQLLGVLGLVTMQSACGGGKDDGDDPSTAQTPDPKNKDEGPSQTPPPDKTDDGKPPTPDELANPQGWFGANTVAQRVSLPVARLGSTLNAQQLAIQLAGYDPGSLLRCGVSDAPEYKSAIDKLGGVTWGYGVYPLEDLSKPRFMAGLPRPQPQYPTAGFNDAAGAAPVEIVKPDIVAVTESAALFYSSSHGLMLVNLTGAEPSFEGPTGITATSPALAFSPRR